MARQASIRFGGLAFDKMLGYVFALFVAKTYGSTEFGLYLFGVGLFEVAFAVASLGFDRSAVREVADLWARGADAEIKAVVRATLKYTTPVGLALGLGIYLAAPAISAALDRPLLTPFLQFAAAAVPASVIADAFLFPTEGLGLQRYTVVVRMIAEPSVKVLLAIAFFLFLGEQAEIGALGLAYSISIVLSAVLGFVIYERAVAARAHGTATGEYASSLLRVGLPACALHLLSRLLAWYDIFLVFTLVSAEATTHYTVALRTALLTTMIATAFDAAFKPAIAGALALERRDHVRAEYLKVSRSVLLFCLPAAVMLLAFPARTMAVLGDQFVPAAPVVAIVAAGALASFVAGPAASALVMAGNSRTPLVNGFAGGGLGVAVAVVLVPRMGMVGAAIGQFAALVVSSALNAIAARRELGVVGVGPGHVRLVVAALVAAGAGLLADAYAPANKYLAFLAVGAAVAGAYLATVAAVGVREEDLKLIRSFTQRSQGRKG